MSPAMRCKLHLTLGNERTVEGMRLHVRSSHALASLAFTPLLWATAKLSAAHCSEPTGADVAPSQGVDQRGTNATSVEPSG